MWCLWLRDPGKPLIYALSVWLQHTEPIEEAIVFSDRLERKGLLEVAESISARFELKKNLGYSKTLSIICNRPEVYC